MEEIEDEPSFELFQEPTDFYQPEKQPTQAYYRTLNDQDLTLRLVGSSPLWVGELHSISTASGYCDLIPLLSDDKSGIP